MAYRAILSVVDAIASAEIGIAMVLLMQTALVSLFGIAPLLNRGYLRVETS
jgi:hypothetical protein